MNEMIRLTLSFVKKIELQISLKIELQINRIITIKIEINYAII